MKPPIFIIGNSRSGTTLLRLMLNAHRNIVVPPECGFAVWWQTKYGDSTAEQFKDSNFVALFIQDIASSRKMETWHLDFEELAGRIPDNNIVSYANAVSFIYYMYGQSKGRRDATRWGDKNNFYINHVADLVEMFPDAHFIHITRDGRDVACSYRVLFASKIESLYAPKLPHKISEIASDWAGNIRKAIVSFEQHNWKNVHEIRYEDLVMNPAAELEKVCGSIGEKYDTGMLEYASPEKMHEHEPKEFLQWKSKTLEKPSLKEISKYKTELGLAEIAEFESIAGDILKRYHYL